MMYTNLNSSLFWYSLYYTEIRNE